MNDPWLCRLGIHRWEQEVDREQRRRRSRTVTYEVTRGRCRRGCSKFADWRLVDWRPVSTDAYGRSDVEQVDWF